MLSTVFNFVKSYFFWGEKIEPVKRLRIEDEDPIDCKRIRLTPEQIQSDQVVDKIVNQIETVQRYPLKCLHQPYNLRNRSKPPKEVYSVKASRITTRKAEIKNHHQSCLFRNKVAENLKKLAMDIPISKSKILSVEDYKKLLGNISFKNKPKNPAPRERIVDTVDLTDEDELVDLTSSHSSSKPSTSGRESRFSQSLPRTRSMLDTSSKASPFVDLTRDTIYDFSVDEEKRTVKKYPPAPKVNSFASKCLAQTPRIKSLEDLENKFIKSKNDFEKERRELERNCQRTRLIADKAITKTLDERLKQHLKITEVVLEEEPDLPAMTEEMEAVVDTAFNKRRSLEEVLVQNFNYRIKRCDILTLSGLTWLNDEVINYYMELINERSRNNPNYPKVYCFGTFFYPRFASNGYRSVSRWTRKVDIFSYELVLVPIHLKVHWCMACIDFKNKTIQFFDSMVGANNFPIVKDLKEYIIAEHLDKKKSELDTQGWKLSCPKDIPLQNNSCDCGIFSTTFAEFLSRRASFTFNQSHMQYFRRKMAFEILDKRLLL